MESIANGVDTQADECGLSLEDHILGALSALAVFGFGLGCEKEYQALTVIATAARLRHGHDEYDPLPEATRLNTLADEELERRQLAEVEADTAEVRTASEMVHFVPDNGQVH